MCVLFSLFFIHMRNARWHNNINVNVIACVFVRCRKLSNSCMLLLLLFFLFMQKRSLSDIEWMRTFSLLEKNIKMFKRNNFYLHNSVSSNYYFAFFFITISHIILNLFENSFIDSALFFYAFFQICLHHNKNCNKDSNYFIFIMILLW